VSNPFTGCPNISSDTTFSRANSPYTITCGLTVPAGVTLTIDAGVTVRMADDAGIAVGGTLSTLGTDENAGHVLITAANAAWGGLDFRDRSAGSLAHTTIEHVRGDAATFGQVLSAHLDHVTVQHVSGIGLRYLSSGSSETIANGTLDDIAGIGIQFNNTTCAQITNTSISHTADYGLFIGDLSCDPDLSGLAMSSTGPGGTNHIRQQTFYFGGTRVFHNRGFDYDVFGGLPITTGHLTIDPGLTIHLMETDTMLAIGNGGSLVAQGTPQAPIRITSATGTSASSWGGINLTQGSSSTLSFVTIDFVRGDAAVALDQVSSAHLDHVTIQHISGGLAHVSGIGLRFVNFGPNETFTNGTLDDLSGPGIQLANASCAQITNTSVSRTPEYGVMIGDLSCDPDLTGLVLSNTGPGAANHIRQQTFYFGGTRTFRNRGFDYDVFGGLRITTGHLTIEPGLVIHIMETDATLATNNTGSLVAQGTALAPIRFTSATGDGASSWGGVNLTDGANVSMRNVQIDHVTSDVALSLGTLAGGSALDHLTVRDNKAVGVRVASTTSQSVSSSNIFGNAPRYVAPSGVVNAGPATFTAINNWWGDPSGPSGAGPGSGDGVSANVIFTPFAVAPVPAALAPARLAQPAPRPVPTATPTRP
jgi:hypothetical protein